MRVLAGLLAFPVVSLGVLVLLATLAKPDGYAPELAGFIYLGFVGVAFAAGFLACKLIAEDPRRGWPRPKACRCAKLVCECRRK